MPTHETIITQEITPAQESSGVARTWDRFEDFTQIPRKAGSEHGISTYIEKWAASREYQYEIDKRGNILILVPATKGFENSAGAIVQAHMDMVCVGEPDPAKNGVVPRITNDGFWVEAHGTSLGADNGIGLAAVMSLPENLDKHGPLALMITVSEEVGLEGAMDMSFQTPLDEYKYLLNFDSEDEGEATISCAGGGDSIITLPIEREMVDGDNFVLSVGNLMGGHSGVEIDQGRINGIKVFSRVTQALLQEVPSFRVVNINAGYATNVIPSNVEAAVTFAPADKNLVNQVIERIRQNILDETNKKEEKNMSITLNKSEVLPKEDGCITREDTQHLLNILLEIPHGVISWSKDVEGLVETSNNLAIVKVENDKVIIETMTRSSVDTDIDELREQIAEIAKSNGAKVKTNRPYPGWPAKPGSKINEIASQEWKKLSGNELKIIAIHAGLECGVIIGKYPHLEAISIGPTIKNAHSVKERVMISSVDRFYNFASNILQNLASNS